MSRVPYELVALELAEARAEGASVREIAEHVGRSPSWVSVLLRWHGERYGSVRPETSCNACGGRFQSSRADARYCSPACRQRAYRRRSGEEVRPTS